VHDDANVFLFKGAEVFFAFVEEATVFEVGDVYRRAWFTIVPWAIGVKVDFDEWWTDCAVLDNEVLILVSAAVEDDVERLRIFDGQMEV